MDLFPPPPSHPRTISTSLPAQPHGHPRSPIRSGSAKHKSRDNDPADDIDIHPRRPRKMPKRSDLWGV
ncbi:hypothetical protein B0H17DRAFT_1218690 [Mycena rosella]|uniref:Uncharacterized protein n=1 Tax=Mycena rosella TaxID=1033263 RepID=A0AAD7FLW5_MYCRO|nr:hypothetical protein B0H17DRAFT_1218690 [Mycena rosella]